LDLIKFYFSNLRIIWFDAFPQIVKTQLFEFKPSKQWFDCIIVGKLKPMRSYIIIDYFLRYKSQKCKANKIWKLFCVAIIFYIKLVFVWELLRLKFYWLWFQSFRLVFLNLNYAKNDWTFYSNIKFWCLLLESNPSKCHSKLMYCYSGHNPYWRKFLRALRLLLLSQI
jgi:hypothetical protein